MTTEEQNLVLGALDSLGVALADHEHEWSEGERTIYEAAVECVQRVTTQRCRLAASRGSVNLRVGDIYAGCHPGGKVTTVRKVTQLEGGWVSWEPIGYVPDGPWRTMKESSFKTWVKGADSQNEKLTDPTKLNRGNE